MKSLTRVAIAGLIGGALEFYDFTLYGYFAPVIAILFFPIVSGPLSLIFVFFLFAIGYLIRPLGGLLFGHLSDKFGRKQWLIFSMFTMSFTTFLLGLLPTFNMVGFLAPFLLMLVRLLQGLSLSGEFIASIVFLVEHAPSSKQSLVSSFIYSGVAFGMLAASLISMLLIRYLSASDLDSWGWRIPFLLGMVIGAIGIYLRYRISESRVFLQVKEAQAILNFPLAHAFKHYYKKMLFVFILNGAPTVIFFFIFSFLPTYLATSLGYPLSQTLFITTILLLVYATILPGLAAIADRIGKKPFLLTGMLSLVLLTFPVFIALNKATSIETILFILLPFVVALAIFNSPLPGILVSLFPANVRVSGLAVGYNLANAIFGGLTPLIAQISINFFKTNLAPSFYLIACTLICFLTLIFCKNIMKKI